MSNTYILSYFHFEMKKHPNSWETPATSHPLTVDIIDPLLKREDEIHVSYSHINNENIFYVIGYNSQVIINMQMCVYI